MCWLLVLILVFCLASSGSYNSELRDKNYELEKKLAVIELEKKLAAIEAVEFKRSEQWKTPMN